MQAIKNPAGAGFFSQTSELTDNLNVCSLLAFRTSSDVERHLLVLGEGFEALNLDFGEVGEQIITTAVWSNEAEAFSVIKPLNCTSCHFG